MSTFCLCFQSRFYKLIIVSSSRRKLLLFALYGYLGLIAPNIQNQYHRTESYYTKKVPTI
jgi:hypothetical protein